MGTKDLGSREIAAFFEDFCRFFGDFCLIGRGGKGGRGYKERCRRI